MICPKCAYPRKTTDNSNTPEYQCPHCGVIYAKYLLKNNQAAQLELKKRKFNSPKPSARLNRKTIIRLTSLTLIICLVFISYVSPAISLRNLRETAKNGDPSDIIQYVDFEKLRDNLRYELMKQIEDPSYDSTVKSKDNPFLPFFEALQDTIGAKLVETMITPAYIKKIFSGQNIEELDYEISYMSINKVIVSMAQLRLIFDREGPFSWRLVGMRLSNT